MHTIDKAARVAGALYLLLVVTAPISLVYIPGKFIVRGDAAATAGNVLAQEMLFRAGIVGGLLSSVIFIFVALALYRLLSGVSKSPASVMVILALISVVIGFVNELNNIAALNLFRGGDFLSVLDKPQRDALGMLFLRLHGQGNVINEVFWGLWLVPFGMLVVRSGFLPRFLGLWLIVNGATYVMLSITGVLSPGIYNSVFPKAMPLLLGEIAVMLWLLIKGARVQQVAASSA